MKELHYYLGFSHCLGIGPVLFQRLVERFKTVEKAYMAAPGELREVLNTKLTETFITFRNNFDPVKKLEEFKRKNITPLILEDLQFPSQLRNIPDPPICLYIKGNVQNFDFETDLFFAIVGTRQPSSYGQYLAAKFSRELSESGIVIVSGLALGVDAIAHQTALEAGGKTIAFLGCGVDIIYPPRNKELYEDIVSSGGLIISEFPPGMTVKPGLFIARNRLISGLSKGVLVVEGTKKSGSLVTGRYAAEQGREVFAPPVPITSQMSEAPNILLKQGATLVTSVEDILPLFDLKRKTPFKRRVELSLEEERLVNILQSEPMSIDDLALATQTTIAALLPIISLMELRGIVEKNVEAKYQLRV